MITKEFLDIQTKVLIVGTKDVYYIRRLWSF
jgi:hypothetical protein